MDFSKESEDKEEVVDSDGKYIVILNEANTGKK